MRDKIRVCLYEENFSPGCLTHHLRNIAKYINRDRFEIFLASCTQPHDCYADELEKFFKPENVHRHPRSGKMYDYDPVTGKYYPAPEHHPFYDFLEERQIDVLHDVSRGGGPQWPLNSPYIKAKKIDSNAFAGMDIESNLSRTMCISHGVYNDWCRELERRARLDMKQLATVVYPAVDYPETEEDLRTELGISDDTIVVGRSSMGYAGDTVNFIAYKQIENDKTVFLTSVMNDSQRDFVRQLGIRNIIEIKQLITNYFYKSKFYNTFDVAVHNRGESFGCSVAEAMIHGKPVITAGWCHRQYGASTAHEELIDDPRYCAVGRSQDELRNDYTRILQQLVFRGRDYCKKVGQEFKTRAITKFAAPQQVKLIETVYMDAYYGKTEKSV